MDPKRSLAIALSVAAALVALLAPWRHVLVEPLCIFEPCSPPYETTSPGYAMGGIFLAPLAAIAALALFLPRLRAIGRGVAAVALVGAAVVGGFAPVGFGFVIFGEELGPAWGAMLAAALSLAALALVAAMRDGDAEEATTASSSGPLP